MSHITWEQAVVASLIQSRQGGYTFTAAWRIALQDCPPRGRDCLTVAGQNGTLFDHAQGDEESMVDAMRRFCGDAWHGRRPKVGEFSIDLLAGVADDASSARIVQTAA